MAAADAAATGREPAEHGKRGATDDTAAPPGGDRTVALSEVGELLDCEAAVDLGDEPRFSAVVASDAMSEILASTHSGALMLTGLTTIQSVRTAIVADVPAIIYLRGKRPTDKVLDLARDKEIQVLLTRLGMFEACGILYEAGLKGEI